MRSLSLIDSKQKTSAHTAPAQALKAISLLAICLLSSSLVTSSSSAETRPQGYDLGFFGGYWEGARNVDSSSYFGISTAYHINRVFSLELNHGFIPTEAIKADQLNLATPEKESLNIQQGALNFVVNLAPNNFVPFFNIGGGWLLADDQSSWTADVGFGAKYYLNDDFALKANLTMWMSGMDLRAEPYDHFTLTMGVAYSLAGKRDIDKDGVKNILDKCPTTPEDIDQFEDGDGCPDKDNDGDGIEDEEDQCRDEAEDEDGDRDEDGCPDLDDDNDGISNEEDKCPKQAEDKDQFEDEDGCLDEDNDKDGILDTQDRCPDEAESVNGFQDKDGCPEVDNDKDGVFDSVDRCKSKMENRNGLKDHDGCPDQVSVELQSLLGLQPNLRFVRNSSKLKKSRSADERIEALTQKLKSEPLHVTITATAHKSSKAQELSLERAHSVMNALRERGVPATQLQVKGAADAELPTDLEATKKQPSKGWISITPWPQTTKYKPVKVVKKGARVKASKEIKVEKKAKTKASKEVKVEKKAKTKASKEVKVEKKAKTKASKEVKVEKKAKTKASKEVKVEKKAKTKASKKAKVEKKAKVKASK